MPATTTLTIYLVLLILPAAAGGFFSEKTALWHSFIAGTAIGCCLFVAVLILPPREFGPSMAAQIAVVQGLAVTAASFIGIWLGKQARKYWNSIREQPAAKSGEPQNDWHEKTY